MPIIAPSILNADYGHLADEINMLNQSEAEWIHLDVMDGQFVPNISFGIPIVESVNKLTNKFLDTHLMIKNPDKFITAFKDAGSQGITVHIEAEHDLKKTLIEIGKAGCRRGIAINPETPIEDLYPYLENVDLVLVMCINPGFGGQKFMPATYDRVRQLKQHIIKNNLDILIEVDGGVNTENIGLLIESGVDVFVVGSFIFRSEKPIDTIKTLKDIAVQHAI
jgi:ribulose-phosphate 3-epimerase